MLISCNTNPLQEAFGHAGAVCALKEAGFEAYDFSMFDMTEPGSFLSGADWRDNVLSVRRAADEAGIVCNQSHAPFPVRREGDGTWNALLKDCLVRALEITSLLGGKICVVHPCNDWGAERNAKEVFRPLERYAKKFGVKIALENMWNWDHAQGRAVACACTDAEDFLRHLNLLDPEYFVACLDLGHAEMMGEGISAVQMIGALKDRLEALHVHGNDKTHDLHISPFTPFSDRLDWEPIAAALREANYRGDLTFEADSSMLELPKPLRLPAARFLFEVGRYLSALIRGRAS